jgi:copper chaperone CopZ
MKLPASITCLILATSGIASAESTIQLTGVHNCCGSCDKGIKKAIESVEGAKATTRKGDVTVTAKDEATAKRAVEALLEAGYYGEGAAAPAVADSKVKSATVSGVHLCCGKCVTAAEKAVKAVSGVTKHTAAKGVESFTVEGDFSTRELAAALNKQGLNGTIK